MATLASTWTILAPSWVQLGVILGHLADILVDPRPAKIDSNRPRQFLRYFSCQGRPQEFPDSLQTSIFQGFGVHFEHVFVIFSKHFFIESTLKFQTFFNISFNFLWERSSRKVPKGRGGGTRPQGVFVISLPLSLSLSLYIYIWACLF
jgi:hypothetical protein